MNTTSKITEDNWDSDSVIMAIDDINNGEARRLLLQACKRIKTLDAALNDIRRIMARPYLYKAKLDETTSGKPLRYPSSPTKQELLPG